MSRRAIPLFLALNLVVACGSDDSSRTAAALDDSSLIEAAREDTLHDPVSRALGKVQSAAVDPAGRIYISDQLGKRVLVFNVNGAFEWAFGRAGGGPGEFESPGQIAFLGQDSVAVLDIPTASVVLFAESGKKPGNRVFVGGTVLSMSAAPERLVLGSVQVRTGTVLASLARSDQRLTNGVPIPAPMAAAPLVSRLYGLAFVAARGDTVAVAMTAADEVLLTVGDSVVTSVPIPARARRVPPPDLERVLRAGAAMKPERLLMFSMLEGVAWLSADRLAVWHKDWSMPPGKEPEWARLELEARLRLFVTVIDRAGRSCVDAEIDVSDLETPALTWRADTLFVVAHSKADVERPPLLVRRYPVDRLGCER